MNIGINEHNIYFHELIGLRVKILQYSDTALIGLEGLIVDETLKTLVIEKRNRERVRVFKANAVFEVTLPSGGKVVIKGIDIIGRPWDRLKKVLSARRR
ncbi:MAG: ribonuclease P protein subunit [Desulfurococcaceae archaeon]